MCGRNVGSGRRVGELARSGGLVLGEEAGEMEESWKG